MESTTGLIAGTPLFMSPEQSMGKPLTPASDWYSLGVLLYQALTGQMPFRESWAEVLRFKPTPEPAPPREWSPVCPKS